MTNGKSIQGAHRTANGYYEVRPSDLLAQSDALVVDIRDEAELLSAQGHIHGVRHLSVEALPAWLASHASTHAPVVLVCENGRRSATTATALAKEFPERAVCVLVGGMTRWLAEDRPVARTKTYV